MPTPTPLSDELNVVVDDSPIAGVYALDVQGLRGPPGPPGPGFDPDAIPRLIPRAIAPGATTPVEPQYSYVWSTIAKTIVVYVGGVWVALAGGGAVDPSGQLVVNDAGDPLVNDAGEVLTSA